MGHATVATYHLYGDEESLARTLIEMNQQIDVIPKGVGLAIALRDRRIADLERELAECREELETCTDQVAELLKEHAECKLARDAYMIRAKGKPKPLNVSDLERELAECKARFDQDISELSECETQKVKLAAQVLQMREALIVMVEFITDMCRSDGVEIANAALALDTKPAEQIVNVVKAQALRKAAEWFDDNTYAYGALELHRMADELEKKN